MSEPRQCAKCSDEADPDRTLCAFHRALSSWEQGRRHRVTHPDAEPLGPKPERSQFPRKPFLAVQSEGQLREAAPASAASAAVPRPQPQVPAAESRPQPSPAVARARPEPPPAPRNGVEHLRAAHARTRSARETDEDDDDLALPVFEPQAPAAKHAPEPLPLHELHGFGYDEDKSAAKPWAMQRPASPDGVVYLAVYDEAGQTIDVLTVRDMQVPRWAKGLALLPTVFLAPVQASVLRRVAARRAG